MNQKGERFPGEELVLEPISTPQVGLAPGSGRVRWVKAKSLSDFNRGKPG
jgi:hypothetical protein